MTNKEKIDAINRWQTNGSYHPLTCGVDSGHEVLTPFIDENDNNVVLKCPTCGYIQNWIPTVIYDSYVKEKNR